MTDRPPLDRSALVDVAAPWRAVEVLEESASTNAVVAERARAGEREGLVVAAEHQSAGRGRLGRVWVTPPRVALTFSVLLTPAVVPAARWPWLPLLAGVAVARAVRRVGGVAAELKWPNDVLVAERKLAGILVERIDGPGGPAAVVGIGINVSAGAEDLPVETATSLAMEGATVERTALLSAVLEELGSGYLDWLAAAGRSEAGLLEEYAALSATLGRQVRVELPGGERITGQATGFDASGRLEVATETGPRTLGAGDVVHVRMS